MVTTVIILSIAVVVLLFLSLSAGCVIFHIRIKTRRFLKSTIDLYGFLKGNWTNVYSNDRYTRREYGVFNGNKYLVPDENREFYIEPTPLKQTINVFELKKTRNNVVHAIETLQIINLNTIIGEDDKGHTLRYVRVKNNQN